MQHRVLLVAALAVVGCVSGPDVTYPTPPPPPTVPPPTELPPPSPSPVADVRVSEIDVSSLPAPYYKFAYDSSGRLTGASFASGLVTYEVQYDGDRLAWLQGTLFPRERLTYAYDAGGKPRTVTYSDGAGIVYVRIHLSYDGDRLVRLERDRLVEGRFQPDKRMSLVYDRSGNLSELTDERLPIAGHPQLTFVDHFERYDTGINVDGFSLIHNEFFDHLVLLPGVRLQVGNPAGVTRSGDGLNYHVEYIYEYDRDGRPLGKRGDVILLNGADAGRRFQTTATFKYE